MLNKNKLVPKSNLHPRNKHREHYDFKSLIESCQELAPFVELNKFNNESIDFFNPLAVRTLNKALLKFYYKIEYWDIPQNYLCPPVPGRADYIHNIADLLSESNKGQMPKGDKIKCLDIGVGANCIYPILGNCEYEWSFVGSDIDAGALASSASIIEYNPFLKNKIELRKQIDPKYIFKNIIHKEEYFDLTVSNPPFHATQKEAKSAALRKLNNLSGKTNNKAVLNFGGQQSELWTQGGEKEFIKNMILESNDCSNSCFWFTTLVSKKANLKEFQMLLKRTKATRVKIIPMGQGNKISRILAWTFLTKKQQEHWANYRWSSK